MTTSNETLGDSMEIIESLRLAISKSDVAKGRVIDEIFSDDT